MDISSSHKAFLSFMLKGSLFQFVGGGNKLRVQDLFRFSFENDLSGCFLKRETPRDLKKRGTKMQCVLLGIFLRMPKNLQPHGKHLQLLNDLKFPASLETDQNLDVDKSWWKTTASDPKRLASDAASIYATASEGRDFFFPSGC